MSDPAEGTHVADILIGTFVILFGLCIAFAGGACTFIWGSMLVPQQGSYGFGLGGVVMLLVSLATLLLGLLCARTGLRMARGKYRAKAADGARAVSADDPPET